MHGILKCFSVYFRGKIEPKPLTPVNQSLHGKGLRKINFERKPTHSNRAFVSTTRNDLFFRNASVTNKVKRIVYPVISLGFKSVIVAMVSISMPASSIFWAISFRPFSSPFSSPCCNPLLNAVSIASCSFTSAIKYCS